MMESAPVVCREVFDENSQPSAEEISDYAQQIGIDPESESHLLPLARDGLMQALAPPWKAYYDESRSAHYYYNEETKKTQWEHPVDNVYRELVRKARDASVHDDTCASVQELNTYEESTKVLEHAEMKIESDDDGLSTDSENQSEAKLSRTGTKQQLIYGRPPLAPLIRPFDKKLSDLRVSPFRRSVDGSFSPKSKNYSVVEKEFGKLQGKNKLLKQHSEIIDLNMQVLNCPEEDNYNLLASNQSERGLPFAGKGSIFIRNKMTDLPSPDTDKSFPLDSGTKSDSLKGILREKMFDPSQKKSESSAVGKPKPVSFEEDRKSVRFQLESPALDTTVSPTSNSSSDQNDGQSSIISAPLNPPTLSSLASPTITPPVPSKLRPLGPLVPNLVSNKPPQLSPLSGRPPLPPRIPSSLDLISSTKDSKNTSGSDKETNEIDSPNDRMSPKRRLLRPPAADYIKADLFKKNFHKISDLVKPGDVDGSHSNLEEPERPEVDPRPRSPMIPQKNKISINLMESIESETSIDSPDKEFANLDLNDMNDESVNGLKNTGDEIKEADISEDKENGSSSQSSHSINNQSPKHKVNEHYLNKYHGKHVFTDSDEYSKNNDKNELRNNSRSDSVDYQKHLESKSLGPSVKISPASQSLELSSPRAAVAFKPPPNAPSKPLNLKTSDSSSSLKQGMHSPKLDGVIISQGKSFNRDSDNVVVMYQFEKPAEDSSAFSKKRPSLVPESPREVAERAKADERRRLELGLYKEIEEMRAEWAAKERKVRLELQKDLKINEEQFLEEKRIRLLEQADKQKEDLEKARQELEVEQQASLSAMTAEAAARARREVEAAERQHREQLARLGDEHARRLEAERRALDAEGERALTELRDQIQAKLNRERARLIDETKAVLETLQEEQAARVADLRQDYRAEVERLRTQHGCHVEELRSRLASERVAAAAARRRGDDTALADKYRCLKEKYARLKHDVKLSIERRNKRREMSMTTGSETEKSNSHKGTQSLERCKEANEASSAAAEVDPPRLRVNNNPLIRYNDNETSLSESQNNNDEWRTRKENVASPETSQNSSAKPGVARAHRRTAVAFCEPPRRRRDRDHEMGATTDCQDSSDATTADEKPKEPPNGHGRRRCFTRLKSASTSRLNYSPKRGEGWSSPLESLRQQLRKLDDLEDQFPDLACQPAYSLRYPFAELGEVASADTPELEFVRHRALVEREGMRRARAVLRRRRAALRESRTAVPHSAPSEGTSDGSSGSEAEAGGAGAAGVPTAAASGAVLRSLRALHADVRDIWLALDARRPVTASPDTSYNPATSPQSRLTLSAHETSRASDGSVAERARGLRAWLQTAP